MDFVTALHTRKLALTPAKDPTSDVVAEMKAEKQQKGLKLQQRLHALSGERVDLPAEVDDVHLGIMRRDAQILEGDFVGAVDELKRTARRVGMDTEPGVETAVRAIDGMLYANGVDWEKDATLRQILSDAFSSLQRMVSQREVDRWQAAKARVKELADAESARNTASLKAIQDAQKNIMSGYIRPRR
jgi:hypothetical protein